MGLNIHKSAESVGVISALSISQSTTVFQSHFKFFLPTKNGVFSLCSRVDDSIYELFLEKYIEHT